MHPPSTVYTSGAPEFIIFKCSGLICELQSGLCAFLIHNLGKLLSFLKLLFAINTCKLALRLNKGEKIPYAPDSARDSDELFQ